MNMYEKIMQWISDTGITVLNRALPFLLIMLAGIVVIRIITKIVTKLLYKSKVDKAAYGMIISLVRVVMYILLALMAASALGIDVSGVLALASVVTLAVSLALQDLLSNLVGGFTLLYTDPFSDGDYVEIAGQSGTVKEIGMTYTKLITPDNKLVQIPNSSVVSSEITNYSVTGTRRVDIAVSASYDAPVEKVMQALETAANVEGILQENGIFTNVNEYGDHAISYVVRVWCKTEAYWDVHKAITLNIKKVFDAQGVERTYPHLNVHLEK